MKIMICAGEASGDIHAAALMRALRAATDRPLMFRGFGGDAMRAEGAELLYHTDRIAIMGITPVLRNLPFLLGMMRHMKREILAWKPDLVLTVDYPGMNLRLARFAHERGIRAAHYICPQVWAWHRGRIPKLARMLDQLLCILPFEPDLFKQTSLDVRFTGHPLVDRAAETRAEPPPALPWHGTHRIALLPGSRASEITRILPRLLEAAALLEERLNGDCAFIIPAPTPAMRTLGEAVAARARVRPTHLAFVDGQARHVMLQAHAAAVASGTATLEACLMRCPTVLVYTASRVTYWAARWLIKGVKHLGLANIIAGREVMPELLQDGFTPQRLADQLERYLADPTARAQTLAALDGTIALLGAGNASARAAAAIAERFWIPKPD
ncbi:MAG TPA: lipid-A-disaccharide synthase [Kiritimatiellia bacterium]|nr:lipid-A-disaccharide synthase [Kiritimatiellia bacterium]HRU71717.1 lipid-A-disaccharide synthase [Kiritimatiellia bacterium]